MDAANRELGSRLVRSGGYLINLQVVAWQLMAGRYREKRTNITTLTPPFLAGQGAAAAVAPDQSVAGRQYKHPGGAVSPHGKLSHM